MLQFSHLSPRSYKQLKEFLAFPTQSIHYNNDPSLKNVIPRYTRPRMIFLHISVFPSFKNNRAYVPSLPTILCNFRKFTKLQCNYISIFIDNETNITFTLVLFCLMLILRSIRFSTFHIVRRCSCFWRLLLLVALS